MNGGSGVESNRSRVSALVAGAGIGKVGRIW